jgi:rSAM/selenodomain-associated transferase 1
VKVIHRVLNPAESAESAHHLCDVLAVMTKAPRTGQVKTRLAPPLTPDEAATLNACFLRDTANALSAAVVRGKRSGRNARGVAVYTPAGSEDAYSDLLPPDFDLIPQREGSFGERLFFAAEDLFKCGFNSVCLIDSDSPTVPASSFTQAMELLSSPDDRIVLGPTDDGGYYLIGLKKPHRELFERIDWSTERVFEQTRERAQEIGVETQLLPNDYDVDDSASLRQLCGELLSENSPADTAPETRKFLKEIIEREGRERIWPLEK